MVGDLTVDPAALAGSRRVGLIALVGGVIVVAGAALPWLTVFGGLESYSGVLGLKGQFLAVGGVAASLLGVWCAVCPSRALRYAIGIAGFALALFCVYLGAEFLGAARTLDGMLAAAPGPGLFVSGGGALLIVGTLVL